MPYTDDDHDRALTRLAEDLRADDDSDWVLVSGTKHTTRDALHQDAVDTFTATGLTPSELAEQRSELVQFARSVVRYAGNTGDDYLANMARAALANTTPPQDTPQ